MNEMKAVGACAKPRPRGFARTCGRVCVSISPAASTASARARTPIAARRQTSQIRPAGARDHLCGPCRAIASAVRRPVHQFRWTRHHQEACSRSRVSSGGRRVHALVRRQPTISSNYLVSCFPRRLPKTLPDQYGRRLLAANSDRWRGERQPITVQAELAQLIAFHPVRKQRTLDVMCHDAP